MSTNKNYYVGGGVRSSNIELLRIIATFFILFIHANFWSLGKPTIVDITTNPLDAWCRTIFESVGIIAVNCFVFISGWFGINFKFKGLINFLFQSLFFYIGITIVLLLIGVGEFNRNVFVSMMFADNWYIMSYLLLLLFSPVLNAYIKNTSRENYRSLLILFWGFALTYGFCSASTFNGGYSPLFFFGLYLLVRYIRIYRPKLTLFPVYVDLLIYLVCTILIAIMWCCFNISCFTYLNPIVIVASIYFSLVFTKFDYNNKVVNWFAASSFAAYLLHTSPCLRDVYQALFKNLWCCNTIVSFWVETILIIFAIIVVAVVIDQLRIIIYKALMNVIDV